MSLPNMVMGRIDVEVKLVDHYRFVADASSARIQFLSVFEEQMRFKGVPMVRSRRVVPGLISLFVIVGAICAVPVLFQLSEDGSSPCDDTSFPVKEYDVHRTGTSVDETRSTDFVETFSDHENIDTANTDANIVDGEATLFGTPAPDSSSKEMISFPWMTEPVHTYHFHPNGMTYDPTIPCLVLSIQGSKALYRVNLDDGSKLDEVPTVNENNTGVAYYDGNYVYSVGGDVTGNGQDLYRYDKNAKENKAFGEGESSKDGYPLTMVGNYIYRGLTYEDGTEDWGKINKVQKVSRADPDDVLNEFELGFTGVSGITYDGEKYLWVMESSSAISLRQFTLDGEEVGDGFRNFYTPPGSFTPCGLAYAEGYLYVLLYKESGTTEYAKLVRIGMKSQFVEDDEVTILSKSFYDGDEPVASVMFNAQAKIPTKTSIDYYLSSDGGKGWEDVKLEEWIELKPPSKDLRYKVVMMTTTSKEAPSIDELEISCNTPPTPQISSPTSGEWLKDVRPKLYWAFTGAAADVNQIEYLVQVASDESFGDIKAEKNGLGVDNMYTLTESERLSDGHYYWRVKTKDGRQGWSPFSPATPFNIDTRAPIGSIVINGGNETTFDREVVLTLTATDDGSGVRDMQITESEERGDNWVPYESTVPFTLSEGEGEKRIRVWFRDAGGILIQADDSIVLAKPTEEDPGLLGMGKVGGIDVFIIVLLGAVIVIILIGVVVISRKNSGYDYDDEDEEDEDEEDEEVDVLEKIRRKREREMEEESKEETQEKELEEDEEEEQFEKKAHGRYNMPSMDDDFDMGESRYGGGSYSEKKEETSMKGPYSMDTEEDEFSIQESRYGGGVPSLDDFMRNIEDMDKPTEEEVEESGGSRPSTEAHGKVKDKGLSDEEVQRLTKQIELLHKKRKGIFDKIAEAETPEEREKYEKQVDEMLILIGELKRHLPELPEEPEEERAAPELTSVSKDEEERLRQAMSSDRRKVGGISALVGGEEKEDSGDPELVAKLREMEKKIEMIGRQQMALQNQMRTTPDPALQQRLVQSHQTMEGQKQELIRDAQKLREWIEKQKAGVSAPPEPQKSELEEKAKKVLTQLQAITQQQAALQGQMSQTRDPNQRQALGQQYQVLEQQKQALAMEAQRLSQQKQQPAEPAAPAPESPDGSVQLKQKAKEILEKLQAIQQQQAAIQGQLQQTPDPAQQQVLTQHYQALEQQKQALAQEAQRIQGEVAAASAGEAPAPAAPPDAREVAKEAKLKEILQALQALQQKQMQVQNQLGQTQDPGQRQLLTQSYQQMQQQSEQLKQQAEAIQRGGQPAAPPTAAPAPGAQPGASPDTEARLKQILEQLRAIQQKQMQVQNQLGQTQDPGQRQQLTQAYQQLQQQAQSLGAQAEALQAGAQPQQAPTQGAPTAAQPQAQPPQAPAPQAPAAAPPPSQDTAQLMQQYQALHGQLTAIQSQIQQSQDPGQKQALTQQYQAMHQQFTSLQQRIQQAQSA